MNRSASLVLLALGLAGADSSAIAASAGAILPRADCPTPEFVAPDMAEAMNTEVQIVGSRPVLEAVVAVEVSGRRLKAAVLAVLSPLWGSAAVPMPRRNFQQVQEHARETLAGLDPAEEAQCATPI